MGDVTPPGPVKPPDGRPPDAGPPGAGTLTHYRPPTPAEWAAYSDRENPQALPARVDNASPAQIAELGELYVDEMLRYKLRRTPKAEALPAAEGDEPGDEPAAPRRGKRP